MIAAQLEGFGANPAAARWLTAEVTFETVADPWVRAGRTASDAVPQGDPNPAALEMLTLALGIRLSRETALGPLHTATAAAG